MKDISFIISYLCNHYKEAVETVKGVSGNCQESFGRLSREFLELKKRLSGSRSRMFFCFSLFLYIRWKIPQVFHMVSHDDMENINNQSIGCLIRVPFSVSLKKYNYEYDKQHSIILHFKRLHLFPQKINNSIAG